MKPIVVAVAVAVLALVVGPAGASHAPNTYCSESGDVCNSVRKIDGKRLLRIGTAARYFGTYELCVTAPDGSRHCENGRMRDANGDGIWSGEMQWAERFPRKGPGAYTVRWTSGGYRSPRLGFHLN